MTSGNDLSPFQQWAIAYADLGAKHVLEHYGSRILGRVNRADRSPYLSIERHNRHTAITPPDPHTIDTMLADGFRLIPTAAECMRDAINQYVHNRITTQQPHDPAALLHVIIDHGCDDEAGAA